jgi:hypothetical protein
MHCTSVSVVAFYRAPAPTAWGAARHPALIARAVPALRSFRAPPKLSLGAPVTEEHGALWWWTRYTGKIIAYREGQCWAMSSRPFAMWPFGLPHTTAYSFASRNGGVEIRARCCCPQFGLLYLPGARTAVRWLILWSLRRVHRHIGKRIGAPPRFVSRHEKTTM